MVGSRLLCAVVAGFLCGVFVRSYLPIGISYATFTLILGSAALVCALVDHPRSKMLFVVALAFASCAGGIVRMNAAVITGDPILTTHLGEHVTLEGSVSREPDVRDTGVLLSIHARELLVGSTTIRIDAGILAHVPPHTDVHYGDTVRVSGTLELPDPFDTESGKQFDYPDYLGVSGIAYTLSFAHIQSLRGNDGNILQTLIIDLKHTYLEGLDAVLPEPEAGLAAGITIGDKRSIGPQLSTEFQKVSLIQMVVLSGYNITVVANAAARLLVWAPRYLQFGSGIFVVIFFILISGGASSAVRAGLMATLAMYARTSRRTYDSLRALGAVAVIMVAWNPFILAFDPGFQLSALAMLGLTLFTPIFSVRLGWIPERFALREIVSSTIATQLAVLPLLLYQDGTLSLLAVPANVLAMLPVPLAMLTSCIAAIGGIVFGSTATPLAFPAYALLAYIIAAAHQLASLPFASVTIGAFTVWWMLVAYAILFGGFLIMQKRKTAGD
ncbi:MAG TPA: ComEC/Rec2 family competence protein [Candidatus Paceibacterota bacterium]|nr:ComEC/Rec2 family competence protein [Candidatus Paceibacterota bacterium]